LLPQCQYQNYLLLPVLSILSQLFFGHSYDFSLYLPAAAPRFGAEKAKTTDNACYDTRKNRLPESNQVKYYQDMKLYNIPCYKSLGVNAKELVMIKLQKYKEEKKVFLNFLRLPVLIKPFCELSSTGSHV